MNDENKKIDFHKETEKILKEAEKEKEKYSFNLFNKKFICYTGVFPPKYFSDTKFFIETLPIKKGNSFLEIGSGTGVMSIFMKLKGASKIIAIDIDPLAVKNTQENIKLHKLERQIKILKGDVFSPLNKQRFDIIFWNFPFGYITHNPKKNRISVYNKKYEGLHKFAKNVKRHLNKNGKIFIGFSTSIGNKKEFNKILNKNNLKAKIFITKTDKHGNEKNVRKKLKKVKYELFEIINNN